MKFSLPRSKKSSEVRLSIPGGVLGGSGDVGGERLNSTSSLDNIGICLIGEGGGSKGVEEAERSSSTSVTGVGVRSVRSNSNGVGDRRERSTLDLLGVSGGGELLKLEISLSFDKKYFARNHFRFVIFSLF